MSKTIYAFMNAYTQGKSGGDIAFIEIFKRIKNRNLFVITSYLGKKLCIDSKLKANFILTTKERKFKNIFAIYIQRVLKALFLRIKICSRDILYATSDALPDTFPIFILKLRNKRVKWVQKIFHLIPAERSISHYSQAISLFLIKRFADLIIVDNNLLKEELERNGFQKNKLFINHLGVDLHFLSKIKPAKEKYDAVFMARLHPSKGIFDLVEIWEKVVTKLPHAKLAVIGKGDESTLIKLKKKVRLAKLQNNIVLLGYLEDKKAFSIIKSGRLFIFPSQEEGFGLVLAEALACGIPVIAYDLPIYRDIFVKLITVVPRFNIALFADKANKILEAEKEKVAINDSGNIFGKELSWNACVKRESLFLNKII